MKAENLVQRMGHLTIQTHDLDAAVFEAEKVTGLLCVQRTESQATMTSNLRRGELSFVRGATPGALAVGMEVKSANTVDTIIERLRTTGIEILSDQPFAPGAERGVRFKTQWGHVIEAHTPVPRDQSKHYKTSGVRPVRLDHASLNAPDTQGLRDLLTEILGMRLSDRTAGNEFMWFRASDSMHHSLGVVVAPTPSLHHYSFETTQFSEFARLGDTLLGLGRKLTWGPGHHGAGAQSYFTYHLDIHGALVEYSQGLQRIEDEDAYGQGAVWDFDPPKVVDWIDMWGSAIPQAFIDAGIPFVTDTVPLAKSV